MAKKSEEGKLSKMDAVRQTLDAGIVKPREGATHIKETFGIDISIQNFSSYKSYLKSKKGKKPGKRGRKPGKKLAVSESRGYTSATTSVNLARDVKRLVGEYGADAVKEMADVFAA